MSVWTPHAVTPNRKLVLPADERSTPLATLVPGARTVTFPEAPQSPLIVMPHELDAARIARNIGVRVPAPIMHAGRFDWPGRFKPMAHQTITSEFVTVYPRSFVLNDPGTGKTASAIWAAEYLLREGVIEKVIVVAPLSCLELVWKAELDALTPFRMKRVIKGARADKARMASDTRPDYRIVNHDALRLPYIRDGLRHLAMAHKTLVIVDEATAFKTHGTRRWKGIDLVTAVAGTWLWLMTGTPHAKDPTDVYGMCRLRDPSSVPGGVGAWKDMTLKPGYGFHRRPPKKDAHKTVAAAMLPAVRFAAEDCVDLPPRTIDSAMVALTNDQRDSIESLRLSDEAKIGSQTVSAVHAAALRIKLFQIAQGVVLDDDTRTVLVDCGPRLAHLADVVGRRKHKMLVFSEFRAVGHMLHKFLEQRMNVPTGLLNGAVGSGKRKRILEAFENGPDGPQIIVAHPKTMAHGLTLVRADTVFWWGPPASPEMYEQGNHRVWRKGQTKPCRIVRQSAIDGEHEYFNTIQEGGDLQALTLKIAQSTLA